MNAASLKTRLIAFAAVVAAGMMASGLVQARFRMPVSAQADAIVLLPDSIDGMTSTRRWENPRIGSVIEQGAAYGDPDAGLSVELDFYRNDWQPHNGANCYVLQGERMRSEALHTVAAVGGPAVFDVMVSEADQHLRLTAATECHGDGCSEEKIRFGAPWQRWIGDPLSTAGRQPVVPASIVLLRPLPDHAPEAIAAEEALLQQDFARIAAQIDLRPAQRLAQALQQN